MQAKSLQIAEAVQTAQAAYDAGKSDLAKFEKGIAAAQAESNAAAAAVKQTRELVAQLTTEHAALLRQTGALDGILPSLRETLAKAEESAHRLPGDADIAAQVLAIKSLLAKKSAEVELTKKTAAEKSKAIETALGQIPAAEKRLAASREAVESARKKSAPAAAALEPLAEKLSAAKSAANQGSKTVEAVRKELDAMKSHPAT